MTGTPSGWFADPAGRYLYRYWDGIQWTNQVTNGGAASGFDPNPLPDGVATTPPAPGTEAPVAAAEPPAPTVKVTQSSGSTIGSIVAVLVAVVAIVVLVLVLNSNSGDDSTTPGTDAPTTTEAPAPTEAP